MSDKAYRLTPEEFKAVAHEKGWSYVRLAQRWEVTPVWVSALARNPERPVRYDDALLGLPNRRFLVQEISRRKQQVARLLARFLERKGQRVGLAPPAERYAPGTILTAVVDVGSIAEEGSRGIVVAGAGKGSARKLLVIFEAGTFDWFPSADLDYYLVETGQEDEGAARYAGAKEEALADLFDSGAFSFW